MSDVLIVLYRGDYIRMHPMDLFVILEKTNSVMLYSRNRDFLLVRFWRIEKYITTEYWLLEWA